MRALQPAPIDAISRLKSARAILDRTVDVTGAGYLLIMFVPGTDIVMRSFKGLDSKSECIAAAAEVAGMMQNQIELFKAAETPDAPNGN